MEISNKFLYVIWVLSPYISTIISDNILVLPGPGYSHVRPVKVMVDILIEEYQHNVTMLLTESVAKHPALMDIRAEIVTYDKDGKVGQQIHEMVASVYKAGFKNMEIFSVLPYIQRTEAEITQSLMTDSKLFKKLGERKYQTVVLDGMLLVPFLMLSHNLSIPEIIHFSAFISPKFLYRVPSDYSGIPEFPMFPLSDTTSFLSRLKNFGIHFVCIAVGSFLESFHYSKDIVHRYVSTLRLDEFYKLANGFSLYLLDQDEILDYPRPVLSNIVPEGGLALSNIVHSLPMEIERHVNTAKDGVVIATFGSSFDNFPDEFNIKLYQAFKNIPEIHFILKMHKSHFQEKNILQTPWLPQNDLLGNKKVKAFITHCGNSGQYEALYHGVPMVAIPIFGDQVYNADRIVMKSFGVKLDLVTFTSGDLEKSIREVVYNDTYSRKIKLASEMYRSKPQNASQRAAYWVHHVTTYGSVHLRSPSHSLPAYKYLALDVVLFVCVCFLSILSVVVVGFCVLRICCIREKLKRD
ncbi:UDP-glucuronosyltransferase 1-6-like [Ostrea edulis]|uniref:UDP-glucuronosyltransferase 1-6-like n=1 Tax=Ostrea edulis TaxID=37623 RepID=UPI0024AF992D|nr:UDP-glucuronosyltransferase 1-6-like [Ostrea edulis]XP_048781308.2 UDP-glucuronosyltransferase 1-6-like [Ostrea edulis]XP_055997680.1 UDP-glucuronosyltransferase 1-6-like [Ostrea edulis]